MLPASDCIILFFCLLLILFLAARQDRQQTAGELTGALIGGYIVTLLYITVFSRSAVADARLHLHPFEAFNRIKWIGFAENMLLFLPAGVLWISVFRRPLRSGLTAGLLLSLGIEAAQYISHRGIADIDDLTANTLGAAVGVLLYALIRFAVKALRQNT